MSATSIRRLTLGALVCTAAIGFLVIPCLGQVEGSAGSKNSVGDLLRRAQTAIEQEDYATAIPYLEWAVEKNAKLVNVWEALGKSYQQVGKEEDAVDAWERAIQNNPQSVRLYNLLAQLVLYRGDLEKAETLYSISVNMESSQYDTRFALARVKLWRGKTAEGATMLKELLEDDTSRDDVRIQLARTMINQLEAGSLPEGEERELRSMIGRIKDETERVRLAARVDALLARGRGAPVARPPAGDVAGIAESVETSLLRNMANEFAAATGEDAEQEKGVETPTADIDMPPGVEGSERAALREEMYEVLEWVLDEEYERAIPDLERIIDRDPTLLPAWQGLGWCYWMTGREDDTITLWNRILTLDPSLYRFHNLLGQIATARGMLIKASEHYNASLEIKPDQYDTRFALARVQLWRGFTDDASRDLRVLLDEDPDRLDVRLHLANALLADLKYEEALDQWTYIRNLVPNNIDYKLGQAQALLHIGDWEAAVELALDVLEEEEDNITAIGIIADAAVFGKRPEVAVQDIRDLIDRVETDENRLMLMDRLQRLLLRLSDEDPELYPVTDAMEVIEDMLAIDDRDVDTHLLLAELHLSENHLLAAEDRFRLVLEKFNPQNHRAHAGLFEVMLAKGKLDRAEDQLREVKRLDPDDPYHFYRLALLKSAQGKYYESLEALDRLEEEGLRGSVHVLLYHGLSPSEWMSVPSVRRFREHLLALRKAGFKFITPNQVPGYFDRAQEPPPKKYLPAVKRVIDWFSYAITGEREKEKSLGDLSPELVACITFDDALRASFRWGTPVAEELGIAFGMHVPVGRILQYDPRVSSWEELRKYSDSGYWMMGSYLMDSSILMPIDREGYKVHALPNRIWKESRNREETPWEYFVRMKNEFKQSREIMVEEGVLDTNEVAFAAYPFGDIGQTSHCNVEKAAPGILNECDLYYDCAFVQSRFGYAMKKQNPLLYHRREPDRLDDGHDVVEFAFEKHPVYLARHTRAEFAALQNKLYLALKMLDQLKRDEYPDDLLEELTDFVETRLARTMEAPKHSEQDIEKPHAYIQFKEPYVGADFQFTRDSEEVEQWRLLGRVGLNITPHLTVEGRYGVGKIDQTLQESRTVERSARETTTSEQYIITTTDGRRSNTEQIVTTVSEVTVFTNIVTREKFKADEENIGGIATYRFKNGSILSASVYERSYEEDDPESDLDGESAIAVAVENQWKPTLALDAALRYERDVIPSALKLITYDAGVIYGTWRVRDWWDIIAGGRFALLSDDNTIFRVNAESMWLLSEKQGFYLGGRGLFLTTDEEEIEYWTPYWLQRFYLLAELRRSYPRAYARVQLRVGLDKEKPREEELEEWRQRSAQAEAEGWYPGERPGRNWDSTVGASASMFRRLGNHWELYAELSLNYLEGYSEERVRAGLLYNFSSQ